MGSQGELRYPETAWGNFKGSVGYIIKNLAY